MKILWFEIENYKSIVKSKKIFFDDFLLIAGKNNSGKSNILKALDLFFNQRNFDVVNDYPRTKLGKGTSGHRAPTKIKVAFELDDSIQKNTLLYRNSKIIKDSDNRIIEIGVEYSRKYDSENQQGKSFFVLAKDNKPLLNNAEKIFLQIKSHLSFVYIPTDRLSSQTYSQNKINELINLYLINSNKYKEFVKKLSSTLEPITKHLSREFINSFCIDNISFSFDESLKIPLPKVCIHKKSNKNKGEYIINIINEGSGLQSIFTFALVKFLQKQNNKNSNKNHKYIFAVEEPEIFLHPPALKDLFFDLRKGGQVIFVTHSSILINELNPSDFKKIVFTKSLKDESLFSQIHEKYGNDIFKKTSQLSISNLFFSDRILIVEGRHDHLAVISLLRSINCNKYAIVDTDGNTNFENYIKSFSVFDLPIFILTDNDTFTSQNQAYSKFVAPSSFRRVCLKASNSKSDGKVGFIDNVFKKDLMANPVENKIIIFPKKIELSILDKNNSDFLYSLFLENDFKIKQANTPDEKFKVVEEWLKKKVGKNKVMLDNFIIEDLIENKKISENFKQLLEILKK